MRHLNRRGVALVELMVVASIIGILSALITPAVLGVRRSSISNQAVADLRAVDIAVQSSCGRGRCGQFTTSSSGSVSTFVPADLVEFLPLGFVFASDSDSYAMEIDSWQFTVNPNSPPVCRPRRRRCPTGLAVATWDEDVGFTNTAGFTTPPTIYVTVSIITRQRDVASDMYRRVGGSPPVHIASKNVYKYSYPVLVGVPATG